VLVLQRCAKFVQFLLMQCRQASPGSSPPPCIQQLQRHMETITSHYIALEEYFVCSQVIKAIRRAHPDRPDALPQLADDVMFIVTRSCTRALSTQLSHAVSATVLSPCILAASAARSIHRPRFRFSGQQRCFCPLWGVQSHLRGAPQPLVRSMYRACLRRVLQVFLKDAAKQFGARAAEAKLSSVESLGAIFTTESAEWQQQQQQQQALQQQQQLAACGGAFKCVEALSQNIPRLRAALTTNLESIESDHAAGGSVALALQSCEELSSLTRDFERLLRDAEHAVVAATRPRFSGAFDAMISAARVPAAAASAAGDEAAKGQSPACLQALSSVDAVYVLFKATLPEAVVENTMMFILQVHALPSSPASPHPLSHCARGCCRLLCPCCPCC
jgi:hypothetical protein